MTIQCVAVDCQPAFLLEKIMIQAVEISVQLIKALYFFQCVIHLKNAPLSLSLNKIQITCYYIFRP